mmetsp:Transcript_23232/g.55046  ORF Transcript_23232/g.55046 Transcript_23232/m.55046 type:complete len:150 (+) Transcript_23232:300-749(+)
MFTLKWSSTVNMKSTRPSESMPSSEKGVLTLSVSASAPSSRWAMAQSWSSVLLMEFSECRKGAELGQGVSPQQEVAHRAGHGRALVVEGQHVIAVVEPVHLGGFPEPALQLVHAARPGHIVLGGMQHDRGCAQLGEAAAHMADQPAGLV